MKQYERVTPKAYENIVGEIEKGNYVEVANVLGHLKEKWLPGPSAKQAVWVEELVAKLEDMTPESVFDKVIDRIYFR